jgi:hypothetical protein
MHSFDDQTGVYVVFARTRLAVRASLKKALLHAHRSDMDGNYPTAIVALGKDERLDRSRIEEGWKQLGLPVPRGSGSPGTARAATGSPFLTTLNKLNYIREHGESYSDVILRLAAGRPSYHPSVLLSISNSGSSRRRSRLS